MKVNIVMEPDSELVTSTSLRCEDYCSTLVFRRYDYSDSTDFEINIEDAYCNGSYHGIVGRFKRAWHAFWAKPICYTGVYIQDPERVWAFLEECDRIATRGTAVKESDT